MRMNQNSKLAVKIAEIEMETIVEFVPPVTA